MDEIQPPQNPDISKTTVVVLVLLTLMISVIGTWTVLNELSVVRLSQPEQHRPASTSGEVQLGIEAPPGYDQGQMSASTGRVSLQIIK